MAAPEMTIVVWLCLFGLVYGDYACLCNYNVETGVYPSPNEHTAPIGYMYEFDCKPTMTGMHNTNPKFAAIQFEKNIGYIQLDNNIQVLTCQGVAPTDDLVTSTTAHGHKTTQTSTTTMSTTTKATTTSTTITTTIPTTTSTSTTSTTPSTTTTSTTPSTTTTSTTPSTTTTSTTPFTTTKTSTTPSTTTSTTPSTTTTSTTPSTTIPATSPSPTTTTSSKPSTTATMTITTAIPTSTISYDQTWKSANVSGTPLQFVGIGYNLLEGNPDGDLVSMVNIDPGLRVQQHIFQLSDAGNNTIREAEYQLYSQCIRGHNISLINSGYAYQQQLLSNVKIHGTPDSVKNWAFEYSNDFSGTSNSFGPNVDTFYKDVRDTCNFGFARLVSNNMHVSWDFASAVCQLIEQNSETQLFNFIEHWGTNIIMNVAVGQVDVERYKTTVNDIFRQTLNIAPEIIQHTSQSLTLTSADYSSSKAANVTIGTSLSFNTIGSQSHPHPISYDLVSIAEALNFTYWQEVMPALAYGAKCPGLTRESLIQFQGQLYNALSQYPSHKYSSTSFNRPSQLSAHPISIPLTWPHGTYTLMQPTSGCPAGGTTWFQGNRFQDTEDSDSHNYFSPDLPQYLKGEFGPNNVRTYYCTKTNPRSDDKDMDWPQGTYCILKYQTCPVGFTEGYISWDDEDTNNGNKVSGTLPTGVYNRDTLIYYCCRSDGAANNTITLPTYNPFILMRYGNICQQVYGMNVHEVYLRWDDQDHGNHDSSGGTHPSDAGGGHDHLLYFCHYSQSDSGPSGPAIVG